MGLGGSCSGHLRAGGPEQGAIPLCRPEGFTCGWSTEIGSTSGWREKGVRKAGALQLGPQVAGGQMRDAGGVDTPAELGAVQTALGSLLGAGLGGKEQALGPRHLNLSWALPFPVHWPLPEHALCAVDTTETWLREKTRDSRLVQLGSCWALHPGGSGGDPGGPSRVSI